MGRDPSGDTRGTADVVLLGGTVVTVEERDVRAFEHRAAPFPTAIALRGGRVLAAGSDEEVLTLAGRGTERIALGGRTVIPGLIDSHLHFLRAGLRWSGDVHWEDARTRAEALERLRTPPGVCGDWAIVLGGWHPAQFDDDRSGVAGGLAPARRDPARLDLAQLDAVAPNHPVYVQFLYEWAQLNSEALRRLRPALDAAADPIRAAFERDGDGGLTGRVRAPGFGWVLRRAPAPDPAAQRRGTRDFATRLASYGLTGVIDGGGIGIGPDDYAPLFALDRDGELPIRVRLLLHAAGPGSEREDFSGYIRYARPRFGNAMLAVLGAGESIVDRMRDRAGAEADLSAAALSEAAEIFRSLAQAGWPTQLHAHNEGLIGAVLASWREIAASTPLARLRWAIVHGERLRLRDLAVLQELGAGVLVQSLYRWGGEAAIAAWGAEVVDSPPLRDVLDAGVPFGLGTDATVVSDANPFASLSWFLTGETVTGRPTLARHQLLSRREALFGYTRGSAWFSFEDRERGVLAPGARADLAVLDDDYLDADPARIARLRSELTLVGGRRVWATGAVG